MRFTSIDSRQDAAVPWQASAGPHADNVEVGAGHLALLTHPDAVRAVAAALEPAEEAAGTVTAA